MSRLPTPGSDRDTWGSILNDYLTVAHNSDGTLKDEAITDANVSASAGIALSKLATDPLARASHTGTQLASTISDFTTAVAEPALDAVGTALTAGAGMTITVDDGNDEITIGNTRGLNTQVANYTLALTDAFKTVQMNVSDFAAATLTVPTNAAIPFPIGTEVSVTHTAAGSYTIISPAGGVTITAPGGLNLGPKQTIKLQKTGSDTWYATTATVGFDPGVLHQVAALPPGYAHLGTVATLNLNGWVYVPFTLHTAMGMPAFVIRVTTASPSSSFELNVYTADVGWAASSFVSTTSQAAVNGLNTITPAAVTLPPGRYIVRLAYTAIGGVDMRAFCCAPPFVDPAIGATSGVQKLTGSGNEWNAATMATGGFLLPFYFSQRALQ